MKSPTICGVAAAFIAMPALAMQPVPRNTVPGEIILYQGTDYAGDRSAVEAPSPRVRTDWAIRSLAIHPGDSWLVCARPRFRGACFVLDRSLQDAALVGLSGRIGSARLAPARSPVAAAVPNPAPSQPARQPGT